MCFFRHHQPAVIQPSPIISGSAQGGHGPDTLWARRLARTMQALGPTSFPEGQGCVASHDSEASSRTAPSIEKQEALAMAFISRGPSLAPDHGNETSKSAHSVLCIDQSVRPATCLACSQSNATQSSGTSLSSTSSDDRASTLPSPAFVGLNARHTGAGKPSLMGLSEPDRWDSMSGSTSGTAAGVSNLSAHIASEFHKWAKTRGGGITGHWRGILGTIQSDFLLYEASDTPRPGPSSSSPISGIDETRNLGRDSVAAHLASSTIRPELLELPPGTYDQQQVTPGPALGLVASSADFVDELNQWATTPSGGTVHPYLTSLIAPPSSCSQDHLSHSSGFASTRSREAVPDVLDPRFGALGADQAGCAVSEVPLSIGTARAGSTTRRNSSKRSHSSHNGLSASADGTSSGSIITSPVPYPSPSESATRHFRSFAENSIRPILPPRDSRRRNGPPTQRQAPHKHATSVSDVLMDHDTFITTTSLALPPAKPNPKRKSDVNSDGRFICRRADCDKTFSTSGHARRHSHVHSPPNPFICPHQGCDASFTRRDNCTQHQRARHVKMLQAHRLCPAPTA